MNFKTLMFLMACSLACAETGADLFQKALTQERASGNLEEAIKTYQRVAREYPKDRPLAAKALVQAARCYEKLGALQKALRAYSKVPQSYHGFAEASFRIGAIYEHLGEIDEALKAYRKVPAESAEFFAKAQQAIKTLETRN